MLTGSQDGYGCQGPQVTQGVVSPGMRLRGHFRRTDLLGSILGMICWNSIKIVVRSRI